MYTKTTDAVIDTILEQSESAGLPPSCDGHRCSVWTVRMKIQSQGN